MLLGAVKDELVSREVVVDLAGDEAFEAADGFFLGAAFVDAAGDVGAGALVADHAGDEDVPERGVGVSVAAAVEAVALLFAAAGVDRGDAAEVGEGCFVAESPFSTSSHGPVRERPNVTWRMCAPPAGGHSASRRVRLPLDI